MGPPAWVAAAEALLPLDCWLVRGFPNVYKVRLYGVVQLRAWENCRVCVALVRVLSDEGDSTESVTEEEVKEYTKRGALWKRETKFGCLREPSASDEARRAP